MFQTLHFTWLKMNLKSIFDEAEQLQEEGATAGDPEFNRLYSTACNLVSAFQTKQRLPNGWVNNRVKALEKLRLLTIKPEPKPVVGKVGLAVLAFIGSAMIIGAYGAFIHAGYHAVSKIFGY